MKTQPLDPQTTGPQPAGRPPRGLAVATTFSLAETCGPVAWAAGRWPHQDWRDGEFVSISWATASRSDASVDDSGHDLTEGDGVVWRGARPEGTGWLAIRGSSPAASDGDWASVELGVDEICPPFDDPVIETLRRRFTGLRPFAEGSIFDSLVLAIAGQSISVAACAVTVSRLAALFHPGLGIDGRRYWPLPRPDHLATASPALVRTSGVTWRRAEALVAAGRAALDGRLPDRAAALADPEAARAALRALPLVGPWTTEATLLWGIALPDAHVTGDVALLRAARRRYDRPEMTSRDLDRLADGWRPVRAWAARLLWADLLGPAPER